MEILHQHHNQKQNDRILHIDRLMKEVNSSFASIERAFAKFNFLPNNVDKNNNTNTVPCRTKNGKSKDVVNTLDSLMDDLAYNFSTLEKNSRKRNTFANTKSLTARASSFDQYSNENGGHRIRCASDSLLPSFKRKRLFQQINAIDNHSTLCRRLQVLEASYGITLKRHLHHIVQTKMRELNISGCVYCMYFLYQKQKRDAEEKALLVRKTLEEQEHLQKRLNEQKAQSDADKMWLESEENKSFVDAPEAIYATINNENKINKRRSWREGLHESGSKSDSEQLGIDLYKDDYQRDVFEKCNKKSNPSRRSIPIWGFEGLPSTKGTPSPLAREQPVSSATSNISNNIDHSQTSDARLEINATDKSIPKSQSPLRNIPDNTNATQVNVTTHLSRRSFTAKAPTETERMKNREVFRTKSDSRFQPVDLPENGEPDIVYQHTTRVVKSVIELSTGVQHANPEGFIDLVKVVGLNLRDLLADVDKDIQKIPSASHKEIEMAHKVLSSDMAELVNKMKIAQRYADTALDQQKRRDMLAAAHTLALDAKNLYDTYIKLKDDSLEPVGS